MLFENINKAFSKIIYNSSDLKFAKHQSAIIAGLLAIL